ncbi:MAG: GNAT family N-acetyltransferase [Thermoplasmatota archaeon]
MPNVVRLDADAVREAREDLAEVLIDAVADGAGLGFLPPLDPDEALAYWDGVAEDVAAGSRVVLAATLAGRCVGSAQLDLCPRPNGSHRAEVQKVMVHRAARRRGYGAALMRAVDEEARAHKRTLLHLDTFEGHDAEKFYRAAGWTASGTIPKFSRKADGSLGTTVIYYKWLGE